jgi:phosphoserine phosphatase
VSAPAERHLGTPVLERLLLVSRRLGITADLNEILSLIIDAMRDLLDAERATVFEFEAKANELFATVAHGIAEGGGAGGTIRFPANVGIAGAAATTKRILNIPDAYADSRFNQEIDRRTGFRTRSILTIPLLSFDDELVGVAQVLNKRGGAFGANDEQLAEALAAQAAVAIKRARLVEDQILKKKMERDLEVARVIQQATFPKSLPRVTGFDIAAWNRPADETGGDCYDVVPLALEPDGSPSRVLLMLADATGHGIGPALMATSLRSMLRMAARMNAPLHEIATHLNEQLCEDIPQGKFITAWLGILEAATGALSCFSAGQGPILRLHGRSSAIESLDADAIPFGLTCEGFAAPPREMKLGAGDIVIIASDGIFEAVNARNEQYEVARAIEAIQTARNGSARDIIARLMESVQEFAQGVTPIDDQTVIVVKRGD